jgi:hypothetical protein
MSTEPDLSVFVGRWASSGRTVARPGRPPIDIEGTDDYRWLPGGHFLVHRVDVRMGGEQVDVLEVIGEPDPVGPGVLMRSYDHLGNTGTMGATVDPDGVWTFLGDTERATVVLAADGRSMAATWERSDDGATWERWMDMEFVRTA